MGKYLFFPDYIITFGMINFVFEMSEVIFYHESSQKIMGMEMGPHLNWLFGQEHRHKLSRYCTSKNLAYFLYSYLYNFF